jgi:hypothetical protein
LAENRSAFSSKQRTGYVQLTSKTMSASFLGISSIRPVSPKKIPSARDALSKAIGLSPRDADKKPDGGIKP